MMKSGTDTRLAWTFLACSLYSLLVVVFFISFSLLSTYNLDLYYKLQSIVSHLITDVLLVGLLAAQVVCVVCAIVACACTKLKTLRHSQWWVGGIMLIVLWLMVAAAILILPHHAPPD